MSTLADMRSSDEKDNSQEIKSQKQKEVIRKIRDRLRKAAAKNKSRLHKKTSSAVRRLQKSSLLKSQSRAEASLYERTLLYNNRKLAHALQNLRHENSLVHNQVLELNHQILDLQVKHADLNCQLFQQQQKIALKDQLISKLGCKFMEVAEILHNGYDGPDNESQHVLTDDNSPISKVTLKETSPTKTPTDCFKAASVSANSNNEDGSSSFYKKRRRSRLSNPFDLSAIMEASDKSLHDIASPSNPDPLEEPGTRAVLSQIDSGKFRRETFVIRESKQILDLPTPVKKLRSRIRMRRSDSFEPMLRLSESPEKPVEVNNVEATIAFPVDMELTTVQHPLITRFHTNGSILPNEEELPLADSKVIANEADFNVQNKDNTIAVTPAVLFDGHDTCSEEESNRCITDFEKEMQTNADNKNFKFVTERLSNKGGKRSTASAKSSSESAGFPDNILYEPDECLNIASNALDGFSLPKGVSICTQEDVDEHVAKTDELNAVANGDQLEMKTQDVECEIMPVYDIAAIAPEDLSKMLNPDEKKQLLHTTRRVSFSDSQTPPKCCIKKAKSSRKKRTAKETFTFKNDEDLPLTLSPAKGTGNLALSKISDSTCLNAENLPMQEPTVIRKPKKLSLKKRCGTSGEVENSEKGTHYPHIPERSALGEVSPNRLGPKLMDNISSVGKPYFKKSQTSSEVAVEEMKNEEETTGRSRRARAPVTYKQQSLRVKMRR